MNAITLQRNTPTVTIADEMESLSYTPTVTIADDLYSFDDDTELTALTTDTDDLTEDVYAFCARIEADED